jgi:hypothetical protein
LIFPFTVARRLVNLGQKRKGIQMGLMEMKYLDSMDALTPKERIARATSMFQWARETIARQILSDLGPMSPERLKWMVALRQYSADKMTLELIQRALANVPH